ncbi:DUF192 domain-containing protein [Fretibacter rubidus]|uniref:DUF192 domain-containing protein n=1 Tax=Fretibacter rubidus TaxID=570162 RepID=UPI00352B41D1
MTKPLGETACLSYTALMDIIKKSLMAAALVFMVFGAAFAQSPASQNGEAPPPLDMGPSEPLTILAETGPQTFMVEIADTLEKQARGYMWREEIPLDTGMLFEFERPKVATIWMKNTPSPLDIIFVRSNGRILKIEHNAQPYTLRSASSEAPIAAVLELAAGRSMDLGIKPGDLVAHEFFGTENAVNDN